MALNKEIEYLIVGQGLAGSLLGWHLIQQGHRILIVDPCLKQTTSRTAAGLINPVTGKRLVKTAGVEHFLPTAKALYKQLSEYFGQSFFHEKEQVRLFQSEDEVTQWEKRKDQVDYAPFLGERFNANDNRYLSNNALGGFIQKQCGYLDTVALLDTLRDFFQAKGCFINEHINLGDVKIDTHGVEWRGHRANKVIFCDGHHLQYNKWFSWLPLQPVQGDILTLATDAPMPKEIVQFGKWLLPLANGQYKLGATWQWQPLDELPNKKAAAELISTCLQYFPQFKHAKLLKTNVGIRPGTRDKQPFLGCHPHHPQLLVFNGFGSKGSLIIPWHCEQFVAYLSKGDALPELADIGRYYQDVPAT